MGFFVFGSNMTDYNGKKRSSNSWKEAWDGVEMDRWVREEKRLAKKVKHKENRRKCKDAIKKGDFENPSVLEWDDLNNSDIL